ncbi:30S ribosomal protein S14 [Frankliniella fusca]|uniref:30S ribosomal protein S14 n=1 Tax=Frankliniella fusca TaxID=407009 RepID=A0AAE1HUS8_9NEOP|nr:30S ribosomal protein S14 [Frankliniella fusca]
MEERPSDRSFDLEQGLQGQQGGQRRAGRADREGDGEDGGAAGQGTEPRGEEGQGGADRAQHAGTPPGPRPQAPPRTRCPCSNCNYECCLLAQRERQEQQSGQPVDVDAIAMELRLFLASQERMLLDVQRYREQRAALDAVQDSPAAPGDCRARSTDQYHAVASSLDGAARRAASESCEHLANTMAELALLRASLGPVVDTVLVSGLHRLRDLRRRTASPGGAGTAPGGGGGGSPARGSASSAGSIMPVSAHEQHAGAPLPPRARFVTFPSEAAADTRLADEWRAVLGRARGGAAPRPRPYTSECLKARATLSSECMGSVPLPSRAPPRPQRTHSASDVASTAPAGSAAGTGRGLGLETPRLTSG